MENFVPSLTSTRVSHNLSNNNLHRERKCGRAEEGEIQIEKSIEMTAEQTGWELTTSCCCQHRVSFWNVDSRQVCRGTLLLEQH